MIEYVNGRGQKSQKLVNLVCERPLSIGGSDIQLQINSKQKVNSKIYHIHIPFTKLVNKMYKTHAIKDLLGFFMLSVRLDISFSCSRFFPAIFFEEIFLFKLMQVRVSFLLSYLLLYWLVRWVSKLASADAITSGQQGYQIYISNILEIPREYLKNSCSVLCTQPQWLLLGNFVQKVFETKEYFPNVLESALLCQIFVY